MRRHTHNDLFKVTKLAKGANQTELKSPDFQSVFSAIFSLWTPTPRHPSQERELWEMLSKKNAAETNGRRQA